MITTHKLTTLRMPRATFALAGTLAAALLALSPAHGQPASGQPGVPGSHRPTTTPPTVIRSTVIVRPHEDDASGAQADARACDRACLLDLADRYMDAVLAKDWSQLPWAERVRHTENDVAMMIGDGLWGTATRIAGEPFVLADATTGNVLWLGVVEEHGQAAYLGLRLRVEDARIADVEAVVAREGTPAHYLPPTDYAIDSSFGETLSENERRPRERMVALVEGYYNTMQLNDGQLLGEFAEDCTRISNGVDTTHGEGLPAEGCRAQFEIGYYRPVERVRARRYPIVDEERGIVVSFALLDHPARYTEYRTLDGQEVAIPVEYPNSHRVVELFKLRNGAVERIEGLAVFQPYLMPSLWRE